MAAKKAFASSSQQPAPAKAVKIPGGMGDVAQFLGLKPEDTIWDYNVMCPSDSGLALPDRALGVAHQGITTLVRDGANGLTLKMPEGLLDYQQRYTDIGPIIEVTETLPPEKYYAYPRDAVHLALTRHEAPGLDHEQFKGKTFISPFPTPDVQESVASLGGQILISAEQSVYFNSKARVFNDAANNDYKVAPFIVAPNAATIDTALTELKDRLAMSHPALDAEQSKYWVKFDSLAGGTGVTAFKPEQHSMDQIMGWAQEVVADCEKTSQPFGQWTPEVAEDGTGPDSMPVLIDLDVGALPNVNKILTNANVQAVCGKDGVYLTGVTYQETSEDGTYIGGILPRTEEDKRYAASAQAFATPVLEAAWRSGYRGYAGVDVLLCEDDKKEQTAYILEMNGRINSSTSLLSLAHWMERESGINEPAAKNLSASFNKFADYKAFEAAFDDLLFRKEESGWTGIVPIIAKADEDGTGVQAVKTIALAPDYDKMDELERNFQTRVAKFQP